MKRGSRCGIIHLNASMRSTVICKAPQNAPPPCTCRSRRISSTWSCSIRQILSRRRRRIASHLTNGALARGTIVDCTTCTCGPRVARCTFGKTCGRTESAKQKKEAEYWTLNSALTISTCLACKNSRCTALWYHTALTLKSSGKTVRRKVQ